ncbi:MAG: hypothetical protein ACE5K9_01485 [Candidatus Methylomirabilales bacterium]
MKEKIKKLWRREEAVATCKLCSTRLEEGDLTCPSCGYLVGSDSNVFEIPGDDRGPDPAKEFGQELFDSESEDDGGLQEGEEFEVDQEKTIEAAMEVQKKRDATSSALTLDPTGLREMLASQPEMLEPGLSIVTDKKGNPIGAGLSTAVGHIDLLARDTSGALVVVMVAERGQGEELVAETLTRIGWVRKELGKGKQRVRGVILIKEVPENLSYAAAAVAETILFKAYRVGVTFEDVEV